ncbi:MAG: glucose-6-phosphate dehydrogenase, partial [Cellulomonas sp.]|nr:glucose-6-phosphate dehydrogenase [Cellulomonas sp.]
MTLPTAELADGLPVCDFTVIGATGDLALRKLIPALYQREREEQLRPETRIIGVSRSEIDDDAYRALVRGSISDHVPPDQVDDAVVERLLARVWHLTLVALDAQDWHLLHGLLKDRPPQDAAVRVFYLAISPTLFNPIGRRLDEVGAVDATSRVV